MLILLFRFGLSSRFDSNEFPSSLTGRLAPEELHGKIDIIVDKDKYMLSFRHNAENQLCSPTKDKISSWLVALWTFILLLHLEFFVDATCLFKSTCEFPLSFPYSLYCNIECKF